MVGVCLCESGFARVGASAGVSGPGQYLHSHALRRLGLCCSCSCCFCCSCCSACTCCSCTCCFTLQEKPVCKFVTGRCRQGCWMGDGTRGAGAGSSGGADALETLITSDSSQYWSLLLPVVVVLVRVSYDDI